MRQWFLLFLMAAFAMSAFADKSAAIVKVTVDQLEQTLATLHGKPDADVAKQIAGLELSERLNAAKLAKLKADLPGDKAREQLLILADSAAFLSPPALEIVADPAPNPAATRQMLTLIVDYVNTTARQLPNFLAVRDTIGFEDKPQNDVQGEIGISTEAAMPLHSVGKTSLTVTYRDRKEVVDEKAVRHGAKIGGLTTSGEFGPILSLVVADALQGKITWARWEQGAGGKTAVFHYEVPGGKSHYPVQFCCVLDGYNSDGTPISHLFKEIVSYHGDIVFNPASGAVLRITMEADLPATELVPKAGIQVEYSPTEIAGRTYICPVKSVSILMAHTAQQTGAFSRSNYRGAAKTYLNDVVFSQYRRFGTESRILSVDSTSPGAPNGPSPADSPDSAPSKPVSH